MTTYIMKVFRVGEDGEELFVGQETLIVPNDTKEIEMAKDELERIINEDWSDQ